MPQYRAYVTAIQYRAFEFEADDEVMAYDHIEKLIGDYQNSIDRFLTLADELGPDELTLDSIVEI